MKGRNSNNYHFKIYKIDESNNMFDIKYFISAKEICEIYNCSRFTIYYKINNPTIKSRKMPNLYIEKIREPIHIQISVLNPRHQESIKSIKSIENISIENNNSINTKC